MARRILSFLIMTLLLVFGCVWLADRPGSVTIHWQGWRLDTTVAILLFSIAALVTLILVAQRMALGLWRFPALWLARRRARKQRQGYLALTDGLSAVATGDVAKAQKLAGTAEHLLQDPQITGLLAAQAAGLAGDITTAAQHYQILLDRPETALSGCQGMITLALKRGDTLDALNWARRAWATGTGNDFVAQTLYDLQARAGQWAEAELTVIEALRRKVLAKVQGEKLRAIALIERATHLHSQGNASAALTLALQAHSLDPRLIPATVLTARLLSASGKSRRASAILHDTWKIIPHPDLAQAWANLIANETPLARVSRLHNNFGRNPPSAALLILAQAEQDAKLWGQARTHLETLLKSHPTAAVYHALAALEHNEKSDAQLAAHWLALAASAPADPDYCCSSCGQHTPQWTAICSHCGKAASLVWTTT